MSASHSDGGDAAPTRRDFLYIATAATGAVAVAVPTWSFVDSMNADASVRALSSIDVDVSEVEVGQQIIVEWRGKPVIIRKRTPDDIEAANAVAVGDLPDQLARNANIDEGADASDANRFVGSEEWLVMIGVCTHLGCVPIGDEGRNGDFGAWYCPCHGSHYDRAGRIRKGPAPENLPVPPAAFVDETTIKIG